MHYDGYQCWIDLNQHDSLPESYEKSNQVFRISSEIDDKLISLGSSVVFLQKESSSAKNPPSIKDISKYAKSFLNTPYLWGGRSEWGIDCSGFTQIVYKLCGVEILRDASQQVLEGESIPYKDLGIGDLIFFCDYEKRNEPSITHVGLYLGGNDIIHASGKVRIDRLDEQGIYNSNLGRYSHAYLSARRMINAN